MKRREKLKVCKLNVHDTVLKITKVERANTECYKIIVEMDAIITDSNYAIAISEGISNTLSFDNDGIEVVTSFNKNVMIVEYTDYSNSEFSKLDVDVINENGDNVLYFKNVVNVFVKD